MLDKKIFEIQKSRERLGKGRLRVADSEYDKAAKFLTFPAPQAKIRKFWKARRI